MKCDICQKEFKNQNALSGHMRMHGLSNGTITRPKCSCILTKRIIAADLLIKYQSKLRKCICCDNYLTVWHQRKFCSSSCAAKFNNELRVKPIDFMNDKKQYKEQSKFLFNIKDYPEEFDFKLLIQHGMFNSLTNKGGISRDHMYSMADGFKNKIDPFFISHPANCKLISQSDNSRKNHNSSITIDELFERVRLWEEKYKK
jgi:hypothetical protein